MFFSKHNIFFRPMFFHEKIEVEKKVEYSFDAELSYLSIGGIFRAIRAAQTALEQFKNEMTQKPSKMYKIDEKRETQCIFR